MTLKSSVYAGHVMHHRLRPREHRLRHNVFWFLLDLADLDRLAGSLRLFSYNRANIFSLYDRDHGDGSPTPLRDQILARLRSAGLDTQGTSVALLCMPRILGYDFNPISVYFCTNAAGEAIAVVYEVNNTFHQRHMYVIPVDQTQTDGIRQSSPKEFYVSPFLDLGMSYAFRTDLPDNKVQLSVQGIDGTGPVINTALFGKRRELTDATLTKLFLTYPLLTLKVMALIHWHALRMWLKGFRLTDQPPTPKLGSTIVRSHPPEAPNPESKV